MNLPLLFLALFALASAPFIATVACRSPTVWSAFDGFVVVSLLGLVILSVLPHAILISGAWVWVVALSGVILPGVLERLTHGPGYHSQVVAGLALGSFSFHAMLDGAALSHHGHGALLALGVVLHRFPVGAAVWMRLAPRPALVVLFLLALATTVGFLLGSTATAFLSQSTWGYFEAFVGGTLLHVALEPPRTRQNLRVEKGWPAGFGGGLGVLGLGVLTWHHPEPLLAGFFSHLLALAVQSAPALLLGFVGASLIQAVLKRRSAHWLSGRSRAIESLKGMVFGLPLPLCSCGVLPAYASLWKAGAPVAAGLAFLVATPEIGVDALLLSMALLGPELAWTRFAVAAVVACLVAVLLAPWVSASQLAVQAQEPSREPFLSAFKNGLAFSFGPLFRHTMPWVLVGLCIAAGVQALVQPEPTAAFWNDLAPFDVLVAGLAGMPMYVCASGATPLVAVLLAQGLSPGAAVAFLLTGPATNATTFGVLSSLHSKRAAMGFALLMLGLSVLAGWVVNLLPLSIPPLRPGAAHDVSVLSWVSMGLLSALFIGSFLRAGPRALIAEVVDALHKHSHD